MKTTVDPKRVHRLSFRSRARGAEEGARLFHTGHIHVVHDALDPQWPAAAVPRNSTVSFSGRKSKGIPVQAARLDVDHDGGDGALQGAPSVVAGMLHALYFLAVIWCWLIL